MISASHRRLASALCLVCGMLLYRDRLARGWFPAKLEAVIMARLGSTISVGKR